MILALDIGGTELKLGWVDDEGQIRERGRASVAFDGYRTGILTTVIRETSRFLQRQTEAPVGVAVSACGQIEMHSGVVIGSNGTIPDYEGLNLKEILGKLVGKPVVVLNDGNAAVLGEWFCGRGQGCSDLLMITLGTGIGGGIITGGRLLTGRRGIAGEIGRIPFSCGGQDYMQEKHRCWEEYASTRALVRRCEEAIGERGLDGQQIFDRVCSGDHQLLEIVQEWIDCIAEGVTGLVHLLNPEMVLIGGGVSVQENAVIAPLRMRIQEKCMPRFAEALIVERAVLGNDAGMLGAVCYFLQQQAAEKVR
ncbi:MAG: ROK family protein [Clostridia bacterium]|nr:ROK family protein [Clostridia bacterium]